MYGREVHPMKIRTVLVLPALLAFASLLQGTRALAEPVQRVEAKRVCMVNDNLFPQDQIPVQVSGKTYFGCCEMCKERLAGDASLRQAVDPVSKKPVDKATAVIGARPDGRVLYFENAGNLEKYGKAGSGS
jgi:YHS domain-containing protein